MLDKEEKRTMSTKRPRKYFPFLNGLNISVLLGVGFWAAEAAAARFLPAAAATPPQRRGEQLRRCHPCACRVGDRSETVNCSHICLRKQLRTVLLSSSSAM